MAQHANRLCFVCLSFAAGLVGGGACSSGGATAPQPAVSAGAVGLSTSRSRVHWTPDGRPVASRIASWDEVRELVGVMGDLGAGTFELTRENESRTPESLADFSGVVADTGEGRWTVQTAIERAIPAMALTTALNARFRSRKQPNYADKLISAMRRGFGGHTEPKDKA